MQSKNTPIDEARYFTTVIPELLSNGRLIYMAEHPELPGCRAQGVTPEEALHLLSEVFDDYMDYVSTHHLPLPQRPNLGVPAVTGIWYPEPGYQKSHTLLLTWGQEQTPVGKVGRVGVR